MRTLIAVTCALFCGHSAFAAKLTCDVIRHYTDNTSGLVSSTETYVSPQIGVNADLSLDLPEFMATLHVDDSEKVTLNIKVLPNSPIQVSTAGASGFRTIGVASAARKVSFDLMIADPVKKLGYSLDLDCYWSHWDWQGTDPVATMEWNSFLADWNAASQALSNLRSLPAGDQKICADLSGGPNTALKLLDHFLESRAEFFSDQNVFSCATSEYSSKLALAVATLYGAGEYCGKRELDTHEVHLHNYQELQAQLAKVADLVGQDPTPIYKRFFDEVINGPNARVGGMDCK